MKASKPCPTKMNAAHGSPVVQTTFRPLIVLSNYNLFIKRLHFVAEVCSRSSSHAKHLHIDATVYIVQVADYQMMIPAGHSDK